MASHFERSSPDLIAPRPSAGSLLAPLDEFYARAGIAPPRVESVCGDAIPFAERALLTEPGPLTTRLETRERQAIALRVLERRRDGDVYARRVVLTRGDDATPLALGVIKVDLARVPAATRARILAEEHPFGRIVPSATPAERLFRVAPDDALTRALSLRNQAWLYGRGRSLTNGHGETVASIVEILVPVR